MATETLQFEMQAVDTAEKELQKAQKAFRDQMVTYQTAAEQYTAQVNAFISKRHFWLE